MPRGQNNKIHCTYEQCLKEQDPSTSEGYPCPVGCKAILMNTQTREIEIMPFNPNITVDWKVIYHEGQDSAENKELVLYNLLLHLGYHPTSRFKFSDKAINAVVSQISMTTEQSGGN